EGDDQRRRANARQQSALHPDIALKAAGPSALEFGIVAVGRMHDTAVDDGRMEEHLRLGEVGRAVANRGTDPIDLSVLPHLEEEIAYRRAHRDLLQKIAR